MIVRMSVVLTRAVVDSRLTVTDDSTTYLHGSHPQSQIELYHVSWLYKTLVIDMVGQLSRDDIVTRLVFLKVRKNGQQKTCNLFGNIAAKLVE